MVGNETPKRDLALSSWLEKNHALVVSETLVDVKIATHDASSEKSKKLLSET